MTAPTTLPDALAVIEELRGQVRDLLQLREQDAKPSEAGVGTSPTQATGTYEFSEGLIPKQEGRATAQHLHDLHQMIETVPDVIFKLNLEGNLTGWNKRLALVTDFTAQELNGRPALAFVPEHEHAKTAAAIRRAFEEGYAELEGHLLTKDGRTIPYHWTGAALRDDHGLVTGITGVGRDITERTKTDELLREMNLALSQTMPGISRLDPAGHYLDVNDHYASLLGYAPAELIGKSWEPTVHPADLPLAYNAFERMKHTGRGEFEARGVRKDGTIFWKHILMVKGVHKEATSIGHHCFVRDITERKEIEEQLWRTQYAFDHAGDQIFGIGSDGRFIDVNESACRRLGYTKQELLTMGVMDIDPHYSQEAWNTCWAHVKEKKLVQIESLHRSKSGETYPVEIVASYHERYGQELDYAIVRDITDRKRTEQALSESRQLLTAIIEGLPDAVFAKDRSGNYLLCNEATGTLIGKKKTDVLGHDDRSIFPPDVAQAVMEADQRIMTMGSIATYEETLVAENGVPRTFLTTKGPLRDSLGQVTGIYGIARDLTERKKTEEALRTSENRLRLAMDMAELATWDWDIRTNQVIWSENCERVKRLPPGTFGGTFEAYQQLVHPDDLSTLLADINRALAGPDPYHTEHRIQPPGREIQWVEGNGTVFRDEMGRPIRMIGTVHNITERKEADSVLRASEARFRAVFENAAIGIVVGNHVTGNGIEQVNPAFCRMSGFSPEELCNLGMRGITHQDDLATSIALVQRLHQDVQFHETIEKRYRTKNGDFFWARTTVSTIRDGSGAYASSVAMIQDITDQKRAAEALRVSEERYARATAVGKVGVWELDVLTERYYGDANLKSLYGYGPDELSTDPYVWLGLVHPEDQSIALKAWESIVSGATDDYYYTLRMIRKDGTLIWTDVRGHAERDEQGHVQRLIGATVNITERKRAESILALENWILEGVAAGMPLHDLLEQLTSGIETIAQKCFCSILLMDADGLHLQFGAAPNLPDSYTAAFDHFAIGPSVACCGTAAYHNKITIVEDIASDPLWAPFKDHALSHGLQACWSMPIGSSTGSVLGTFAVYYRTPRRPTYPEIQLIEQAARLAQIAIERHRAENQLRQTQFAMDHAMDAVYWANPEARILYVNEAACRMLGYSKDELLSMTVHDLNPGFESGNWPNFLMGTRQRGTWSFETQHRAKDGRSVPVDIQISCLAHAGHEFLCAFVRDISERKRREEALINIVKGVTSSVGSAFFHSLTTHLAAALGADYAVIGEVIGDKADRVRTISVCADGHIADNFEYGLLHTPCHSIIRHEAVSYLSGVRNYFSQFSLLAQLGVDRYSGTPLLDSEGRVLGIMAVLYRRPIPDRELTESMLQILASRAAAELERQQAEQALRASEERLRLSLLASNTGLWDWNTETNEVWLSPEWKKQIGYDDAELPNLFETWESRLHPDDHDRAVAYAMQYREHPVGAFRQEFRLRHKDGTYRWIDVHASFVTEVDGRRVRLLGSHTDITERKRTEAELQRSHTFLRQVIDTTPNFIFAKDRHGRFTLVNQAIAEAYGTTVDNLLGKSDADFNPHRDEVEFFTKKDLEVLDSLQERFIPEEKITDSAGHVRWLQTVKRPLLDDTGQATMVLGASTDITARKGVEQALRRRESDLKAAIAERERISEDLHDGILQSIYAVGLGLEACKPLIKDQPKTSGVKLKTALQHTIEQLNHVLEEVRNFIAGLESHILDGQEFDTVLRTMVSGLAASYSVPCRATVEKAAAQRLSTEQAYHVMNVAREALSNSLRHSRARRITLSLKSLSRSVRLSVTDNGIGFTPSAGRGIGHGLANMESRATKIGGTFTLQSTLRGGTKVILELPMRCTDAGN